MRMTAAEKVQEERFARLAAEHRSSLAAVRALLSEERRCRRALENDIRQLPTREDFKEVVHRTERNRHEVELQLNGAVASVRTDLYGENGIAPKVDTAIGKLQDDVKALQIAPAKQVLIIVGTIITTILTTLIVTGLPKIIEILKTIF